MSKSTAEHVHLDLTKDRRPRVVGSFPNGNSALMLVCARIWYVTANEWSNRRYLDMSRLDDNLQEAN